MKMRRLICALLLAGLIAASATAQAAQLERAWMVYEDYSGNRAEEWIQSDKTLRSLEKILLRAKDNRARLDGCTMNCTLFCMTEDGDIYDFACATDGCPYIQSLANKAVYTLGVDYLSFWELFPKVQSGMGFEASAVFDW